MDIEKLTVGELREITKLVCATKPKSKRKVVDGGIRIVILQRGWVAVGRYHQDGSDCQLTGAAIIRRWGTSKGLGEIASGGPTANTQLEPTPTIRFHEMVAVASIDCLEDKWEKHLK